LIFNLVFIFKFFLKYIKLSQNHKILIFTSAICRKTHRLCSRVNLFYYKTENHLIGTKRELYPTLIFYEWGEYELKEKKWHLQALSDMNNGSLAIAIKNKIKSDHFSRRVNFRILILSDGLRKGLTRCWNVGKNN
jgi:hypothetical protein